jgi:molybdenum cofactor synthesis domain-containing protein
VRICVVTVSDRASSGEYDDLTGPAVKEALASGVPGSQVDSAIVPDERDAIIAAVSAAAKAGTDVVVAAGGTGLSDRDVTPEALMDWGERAVPGIAEYLRVRSLEQTNRAALSRGVAVQRGRTLAITVPGSVRGARFCAEQLAPLLEHAVSMMAGGTHSPA